MLSGQLGERPPNGTLCNLRSTTTCQIVADSTGPFIRPRLDADCSLRSGSIRCHFSAPAMSPSLGTSRPSRSTIETGGGYRRPAHHCSDTPADPSAVLRALSQ
jgi:hypothetical protein